MPLKKNIVKKGGKTIIIKTQQKDKFCLTVLLTITADESKLPPFLIFKGKPNGTIEKELSKDKYLQLINILYHAIAMPDLMMILSKNGFLKYG